ncbi:MULTISPECIES: heme ABC transporter ATP-binding protein [unclassified Haematospirillum]|uniref:heme ABC transporter ATP-binding protein n=1 Tax=unclassified Haematospirillum TaxID=2622088 RepID=UPI00143B5C61|nr:MULTISPECIES: heme ABC transporter ATP-binding protein [unclassified Haematospirillum]NKD55369.1 heme ABC transporter ATP-binding protein [Haematospirillum sp. H4890]NKD75588.1 heme ABC transporter ATP-binding protein [Haematospirillum sp. H4485]
MSLDLSRIHVQLGNHVILSDISLSVHPGTMTIILGPNGSGKSTLLSVMAGERKPDSGQIQLDNTPLEAWPLKALARRRAVLPQNPSLQFGFSVTEVVQLGLSPHQASTSRHDACLVDQALQKADIHHLGARNYLNLSGGEQQRTHFARVLAQLADGKNEKPGYLLLDEPTSSLDPAHQHQILAQAKALARQGNGVVAVLHDLNLAAAWADHIILLADGKITATGHPDDVLVPDIIEQVFTIRTRILDDNGARIIIPYLPSCAENDSKKSDCL